MEKANYSYDSMINELVITGRPDLETLETMIEDISEMGVDCRMVDIIDISNANYDTDFFNRLATVIIQDFTGLETLKTSDVLVPLTCVKLKKWKVNVQSR